MRGISILISMVVFVGGVFAQQDETGIIQNTRDTGSSSVVGGLWEASTIRTIFIKLIVSILVVGLLLVVSKFFSSFITKRIRANSIGDDEYTRKVSGLIGEIIFYTLTVFSLLIGFTILGIDFGWIMGGISFGIGFAFKDILGNLLAGILVLTNKEFKLGDIIEVDYKHGENFFGRIEEITIRYTTVRTLDLRKVIIPNLDMVMNPVRTYDSEELVRLDTSMTIHYSTKVGRALDIIKAAVNALDFVREKESTKVMIEKMGKHGLDICVFFYIDPTAGKIIPIAKSEVNDAIYAAFIKEGIVIPYPHTTVTVDHNDKNLLGSALYMMREGKK